MNVELFDYTLPPALIASRPAGRRDESRLLVATPRTGQMVHSRIARLSEHLPPGALLIANDSRVFPARLFGWRPTGGKVEVLLVRQECHDETSCTWTALCKSNRPVRHGDSIRLCDVECVIVGGGAMGEKTLQIPLTAKVFRERVDIHGTIPLPPYIKRDADDADKERYQTVFAKDDGSVAAPTAGLHLSDSLIAQLEQSGRELGFVTLHVGPGTFRPISRKIIQEHEMDLEYFSISQRTVDMINRAQKEGRAVIAVGTTVVRALEACVQMHEGRLVAGDFSTRIFIYPPYSFKVIDGLLTNFHLPRSTLLCLVSALGGRSFILDVYREAVAREYRFYSYGDAMLVL